MKKSLFLLGLLTTAVCVSACGSKNFNMSFEDALDAANYSELQNILSENDIFAQDFNISGNYDANETKINAEISSSSKQNLNNKNSESSTKFSANISSSGESVKLNWALDIKLVNDALYLNLSSLELTGSEEIAMYGMMVERFKSKWYSIPMTGLSDIPNTFSILKDSKDLNSKAKDIIINEWAIVYSWKFSQFNGYNARKISLDNEKLNELIKEYYNTMNNELSDELTWEIPEINIQNFEWYLIITWKDKVTTVIENMQIQDSETVMNANWYAWKDYEINMYNDTESLIKISAKKKFFKYKISANIANTIYIEWNISPKLSTSKISLKFNATLTIKSLSEWQPDTVIPFKGSWKYDSIPEFTTTTPDNAQDLTEVLSSYLWGIMWGNVGNEDYEALYNDSLDVDNTEDLEENETTEPEATEEIENTEE